MSVDRFKHPTGVMEVVGSRPAWDSDFSVVLWPFPCNKLWTADTKLLQSHHKRVLKL